MVRDYWIYQERDVLEPWAVHVWLLNDMTLNLAIYAEWIPAKAKRILAIPATFEDFTAELQKCCNDNGQAFTVADMKQLNRVWVKMAISVKLD